jgi:hypothetical protein
VVADGMPTIACPGSPIMFRRKWRPPKSPEHAAWRLLQRIMGDSRISRETKLYYWRLAPREVFRLEGWPAAVGDPSRRARARVCIGVPGMRP